MAVAKRQGRGKLVKTEQRKVWGPEWGPQVEQTAVLASPIYIGQAKREEKIYKKCGQRAGGLSPPCASMHACMSGRTLCLCLSLSLLFTSFGLACPHTSRMYVPLFSKENWAVTLICLRAITWSVQELWQAKGFNVHHFKVLLWRDRTKEITHSPDSRKQLRAFTLSPVVYFIYIWLHLFL